MAPGIAERNIISNPVQRGGMLLLLPYLLIIYSRVFDVKFAGLHIPGIIQALLIILLPASTRALKVLWDAQIGKYFTLFTLWALAIIPFAVWRGGALQQATQVWPHAVLLFIAIGCLLGSLAAVRRAIYFIGFGIIVLAVIAEKFGDFSTGRLTMQDMTFGNPNDLAAVVLMGIPFVVLILMEGGVFMKVVALGAIVPLFVTLLRTGSRAGMLGFLTVAIFLFFRCSIIGKIMVAVGGTVVLAAALTLLPHTTLERYITFFHTPTMESQDTDPENQQDSRFLDSAVGSSEARLQILKDSIRVTFQHPIFGVGMGNFPVEMSNEAKAEGRHAGWNAAHNGFTQVSSETGLVGLFFYMGAFVGIFRRLNKLKKFADAGIHLQSRTISRATFCLQTSLVSYAVTSSFAPVGYLQMLPTLAGLTLALTYAVQPEFEAWQKQTNQAAMTGRRADLRPTQVGMALPVPARRSASA